MSRARRLLRQWGPLLLLAATVRHGWAAGPPAPPPAAAVQPGEVVVTQRNRAFDRRTVQIPAGGTIRFDNQDDFDHQVFVDAPAMSYESEEQPPGHTLRVAFPHPSHFDVQCRIHPKMHLQVDVK